MDQDMQSTVRVAQGLLDKGHLLNNLSQEQVTRFIDLMLESLPGLCTSVLQLTCENKDLRIRVSEVEQNLKTCRIEHEACKLQLTAERDGLAAKIARIEGYNVSTNTEVYPVEQPSQGAYKRV